jgi:hypothetical protein
VSIVTSRSLFRVLLLYVVVVVVLKLLRRRQQRESELFLIRALLWKKYVVGSSSEANKLVITAVRDCTFNTYSTTYALSFGDFAPKWKHRFWLDSITYNSTQTWYKSTYGVDLLAGQTTQLGTLAPPLPSLTRLLSSTFKSDTEHTLLLHNVASITPPLPSRLHIPLHRKWIAESSSSHHVIVC